MLALSRTMLLGILFSLSGCLPVGDPLVNLDAFIEDLFRFQLDPIDVALLRSDPQKANQPPADIDERRAVHLVHGFQSGRDVLTCNDVTLLGYDEWEAGNARARRARENAVGNQSTAEMQWPNFWNWNSPALAIPQKRTALLGTLFSATYEIALLGGRSESANVVNNETQHISAATLERVLSIRGRGYQGLYDNQLASKSFSIETNHECETLTILTLTIQ